MGIFGAMTTAVSGLSAQSFALEIVSGNIANSRTPGFRRVDASFSALISDQSNGLAAAGSVLASSRTNMSQAGDFITGASGTNIAISGEGFFPVQSEPGQTTGAALPLFSRRGDFELNARGYLVNGAGHVLKGYAVDPVTGLRAGGALSALSVPNEMLAARATTMLTYEGNLPRQPATSLRDPAVPGSELLSGAAYTGATIAATDEAGFLDRTIAGQAVTLYNDVGTPIDVQLRWGKTAAAVPETWSLYYLSDPQASGAQPRWTRVTNAVQFDAGGRQTAPLGNSLGTTFTVGGNATGPVTLSFGAGGLTQFDDASGAMQQAGLNQDGFGVGTRVELGFESGGHLVARYSNGQARTIADVPIMSFAAPWALKRMDGGAFEQTMESGQPVAVEAGSRISGGTLEMANVDIADEFSKMIVTQQAYSANTRVISTAQQMIQEAMSIVR